jgi:hypothetical protein
LGPTISKQTVRVSSGASVDDGDERKEHSSHCDAFASVPLRPEPDVLGLLNSDTDVLDLPKSDTNVSDFRTCAGFSGVCRV